MERIETVNGTAPDEAAAVGAVPSPQPAWERALPWLMALVFAGIYSVFALARFERPTAGSFDLGIFEQAIRHYAHLQAPIVDLEGAGHNYLGDHWNPAIAFFAPFYRIFPSPQTLLVGQAVVIALAVVPITRAGMRYLGRWSGIAVGLAFGLSYGIQGGVNFEIHAVCLTVPLLAFALEAYLAGHWRAVAAWSAPLVLVQEDLGLTVFMLGLVLALVGARRWGAGLAAFGLASFALTMTVLIPHFSNGDKQSRLTELAAQPGGSLLHRTLGMPLDVFTSVPKATTILLLLAVTVFIGTQSPLLILVLPTLAWRFIVNDQTFWGQGYHYDLMLMPIVFAALIDGVRRSRRDSWRPLREYARAAPVLALLVALFLCTRYPFRDLVNPVAFSSAPRALAAERVLAAVPDGVTIETDLGLMRMLTQRTRVFYVGNAAPVEPEYLLVNDEAWKPPLPDVAKYAESLHPGKRYVLVTRDDGYTLVHRIS